MARILGRVVGQGNCDDTHIAIIVDWSALTDNGQFIANGNDAVPVLTSLTDTELEAATRESLAKVITDKGLGTFTSADVVGCKI